jgi:hypothetical protein
VFTPLSPTGNPGYHCVPYNQQVDVFVVVVFHVDTTCDLVTISNPNFGCKVALYDNFTKTTWGSQFVSSYSTAIFMLLTPLTSELLG